MKNKHQPTIRRPGGFFGAALNSVTPRESGLTGWADRSFYVLVRAIGISIVVLAFLLLAELVRGSWESVRHFGFGFLVGTTWDPVAREFGTLPTIVGTLVKAVLALLVAVPLSMGTAIFIAFYSPKWFRPVISYPIELLAGIPSVIYGLWGIFIMVPIVRVVQVWLKTHYGWIPLFSGPAIYGVGVLAGGVILAIMIAPIITSISRDILLTVPRSQVEAMLSLGATQWEAIWKVVLPYARTGLVGAVVLGLGRAIGETMAITMVGGNSFDLVHSLFDPVHSMASQIASEFTEATYSLYVSSLIYVGLVLFGITILISLLAQMLIWRLSRGRIAILD